LRDAIDEIRERGAELVIIGNGSALFARGFRDEFGLDCPMFVDPSLRSYRAAGLRRGHLELFSPRLFVNGARALRTGARQTGVHGDPWQLGGVFVVRPGNTVTYAHVSEVAGDHAPVEEILAALDSSAHEVDVQESSSLPPYLAALEPLMPLVGRALSLLVDPTIFLSFDRTGFLVHSLSFEPDDLDVDLTGRRCVVTGASGGLGFETAMALADLGADVVMICRSVERGEAAANLIREATESQTVSVVECDLADLEAVRRTATELCTGTVDVLIHNAGLLPDEREMTADGLEMTFAVHVAAPYVLTELLVPALERSHDPRVVFVSSGGMYARKLSLDDLEWEKRDYDGVLAYAQTKRMQVILAEVLAEELDGFGISVNSMHPGWADTPGVQTSLPRFHEITRRLLRTPAEGADTIVWLAASEGARGATGKFFFDRQPRTTYLLPFTREDRNDRERLVALCEELVSEPPAFHDTAQ
jgi:dehydrogenase/reductase SDR family protein 12